MDITTILGVVIGFVLIFGGIMVGDGGIDPGKLMNFVDVASIIIVLGGTIAAVVASYPVQALKQIPKHMKIMMDGKKFDPMQYIEILVELAQYARKNGLLALEERAKDLEDPFFQQGIMLIVDATDPDRVRDMLNNDLDYLSERHDEGAGMYEKASAMAPAFGMVGTLIGLVNMLKGMNMDAGGASKMGEDMSVALITTFYGVVLANLIFSPIAKKLRIRNNEEYLCKQIIIEGVLSIQSGENPKFLREKLTSFLAQQHRESTVGEEESGGAKKGKKKKGKE